jgi:hypothetical protein
MFRLLNQMTNVRILIGAQASLPALLALADSYSLSIECGEAAGRDAGALCV